MWATELLDDSRQLRLKDEHVVAGAGQDLGLVECVADPDDVEIVAQQGTGDRAARFALGADRELALSGQLGGAVAVIDQRALQLALEIGALEFVREAVTFKVTAILFVLGIGIELHTGKTGSGLAFVGAA